MLTALILKVLSYYGPVSIWVILRLLLDVALVVFIGYKSFKYLRGTRAVPLLNGLLTLGVAYLVTWGLGLQVMMAILNVVFIAAWVAVPVIFQPELRRALERLGRRQLLRAARKTSELKDSEMRDLIDQIVRAVQALRRTKTGALIVIEREQGLAEFIDTGVRVDGAVTWELLVTMFFVGTPLHDGAVIIRCGRLAAAAAWLPLAQEAVLSTKYGSRHRAAVGVVEHSDSVAVVISEETGDVSVCVDGKIHKQLDEKKLTNYLAELLARSSARNG